MRLTFLKIDASAVGSVFDDCALLPVFFMNFSVTFFKTLIFSAMVKISKKSLLHDSVKSRFCHFLIILMKDLLLV